MGKTNYILLEKEDVQFMNKVTDDIEKQRSKLTRLLLQKDNLLDPDVILLSKRLDKLLCKYYRIRSISRAKFRDSCDLFINKYNEA